MAISLSELTGASTSGNVLNEVNSYADFLDSVPRLVNKADPTGATDATQTTATKQPVALPLIDGEGYLFCSGINGNGAVSESPILPSTGDFDLTIDFVWKDTGIGNQDLFGQYDAGYTGRFFIYVTPAGTLNTYWNGGGDHRTGALYSVIEGRRHVARFNRTGNTFSVYLDGSPYYSYTVDSSVPILAIDSTIGNSGSVRTTQHFKGAIFSVTEGSNFECDFNSPRIPHGATEFTCETGQVVTVNTSGNNPSKVIKKAVLRYDGVDDFMDGVFGQTVTGGYMFAAFSVNGDGGNAYGRIFGGSTLAGTSIQAGGFAIRRYDSTSQVQLRYNAGTSNIHSDIFNGLRGDLLYESKLENTDQQSRVNDADADNGNSALSGVLSVEDFEIAGLDAGVQNSSIDLEYLAFFPSLTDAQADQVRNFINNRNKVFTLIDSQGYYFFDGAATDDGQVFTGSGSWNGRIVGSDNGDSDFYISQNTLDDRPTTDGYKITFADNTDHFDIPSTTQAGWQIVGTSLGTFAYKVDSDAITELNLLGNAAIADGLNYRQAGDLYGIILLPESATNRDIEEARKLLIDRGASDGASVSSFYAAWYKRRDVVEFRATMPQATDFRYAWKECTSLTSFSTQLPEVTNAQEAWYNNASLSSFTTTDLKNCSNFSGAWQFCTSLTQFPSDAKLGTEVTGNVDFTEAWRATSLTSFSTPLPTATTLTGTWRGCPIIESFSTQLPEATRVDYAWYNDTSLSSFTTTDLKNCSNFDSAWRGTSSLKSFPNAQLGTEATNVNFQDAWRDSGLTSFPALDLSNGINLRRGWFYTPLTSFGAIDASRCPDFTSSWHGAALLTSFPADAKLGTETSSVTFNQSWHSCGFTSFSTPLQKGRYFYAAWFNNSSLTDFSADVFVNWNPDSITNGIFNLTWDGCSSLTTQSVENILVGISNSGKHATTTGLEGGTALSDATIDIDYNTSTGSLTAATLSAIETLNGRGWSVNINNEIIVPNILQLQPAAAYSLRSFDADADPTVVNVRRSSDGSLSDFTASQVSDGTLEAWVGAGNDGYVTTWYDQSGSGNDSTQSTASSQPLIVENGVLVTENGEAAVSFDGASDSLEMNYNNLYGQSTLDSYYVTSTSDDQYIYPRDIGGKYGFAAALGQTNSTIHNTYGTPSLYSNGALQSISTRDDVYSSNNGYKLVTHQGADTSAWTSFLFGKYTTTDSTWDYAGKLQEMIFFNTDQSANRAAIENNINDHFNIY